MAYGSALYIRHRILHGLPSGRLHRCHILLQIPRYIRHVRLTVKSTPHLHNTHPVSYLLADSVYLITTMSSIPLFVVSMPVYTSIVITPGIRVAPMATYMVHVQAASSPPPPSSPPTGQICVQMLIPEVCVPVFPFSEVAPVDIYSATSSALSRCRLCLSRSDNDDRRNVSNVPSDAPPALFPVVD